MRNNTRLFLNQMGLKQIALILFAVLATLAAAVSGIFYPSTFSPLIAATALIGLAFVINTFQKPIYALYLALFISILPTGLLSNDMHSLLNKGFTFFAMATWGLDLLIHRRPLVWTITTSLMLSFIVWSAVTLTWAPYLDPGTDIFQTYIQRFLLFFIIFLSEVKTKDALNGVMRLLAAVGLVIIILSLNTLISYGYTPGTRFALGKINENDYGVTLVVTMMGALWEGMRPENGRRPLVKWFAGIFVLFVIGLTLLSGSRGSAITLAIILAFFAYMKPVRIWAILLVGILILAYLFFPVIFQTTIDRFLNGDGSTMLGGREPIWRASLQLIAKNFWFGLGIGNAPYVIRNILLGAHGSGVESVSVHNPLLAVFSETGLLGILLYVGMIISAFVQMIKQYRDDLRSGYRYLMNYYPLVSAIFIGYMSSWIKGGGMERDSSLYLLLSLLLIPSLLEKNGAEKKADVVALNS